MMIIREKKNNNWAKEDEKINHDGRSKKKRGSKEDKIKYTGCPEIHEPTRKLNIFTISRPNSTILFLFEREMLQVFIHHENVLITRLKLLLFI